MCAVGALALLFATGGGSAPPALRIDAPTVEATSPGGAIASYTVKAFDPATGAALNATCAPPAGTSGSGKFSSAPSNYPIGTTTVTCDTTTTNGTPVTKAEALIVRDTTRPVFSNVPPNVTQEADRPAGSTVTYMPPTAVDNIDGPLPVSCTPASGTVFRLGTTIVTCVAKDAHDNSGSASFTVTIVDTTPPRLVVPPNSFVYATSDAGIPVTAPAVQAFLGAAVATDLIDPNPSITTNAAGVLPIGANTVEFRARDVSGNVTTRSAVLTVRAVPPPGTPQPPPPIVDRTPPDDISGLKATVGNRLVRLAWTLPKAKDFDHLEIGRAATAPGATQTVVYSGKGTTFSDRNVANDVAYRYVVTSFDGAGNGSKGVAVTVTPKRPLLVSPVDGAKVTAPPTLVWIAGAGGRSSASATAAASYYNVQLFRGRTKVLSAWPTKNRFALRRSWEYNGRRYRLLRGTYRWYVWPGVGPKSEARYGSLLGMSTFSIIG